MVNANKLLERLCKYIQVPYINRVTQPSTYCIITQCCTPIAWTSNKPPKEAHGSDTLPPQTSLKPFNFPSTTLPHSPLLSPSHSVASHNYGVQHWWNDSDSKTTVQMAVLQVRLYWCNNHNWTDHMQQLTFTISTTASTPPAVMPQLERSTLCMLVSNLVAWQISWQPSSPIGLRCREMCWSDLQLCMPCNHTQVWVTAFC